MLGAMTYEVLINILYKLCLYKVNKDVYFFSFRQAYKN